MSLEPFDQLGWRQGCNKSGDRRAGHRMAPIRRQVGERPQYKGPLGHAWVRQGRFPKPTGHYFPTKIQQIQVNQPGGVSHGSDSAEGLLDCMHLG